ncbi:diguanylate cyclase [Hujiaoplasma nucleasis]|uniref:Diguanylate cyclase n=1 Tax=Hujiaoplasma nucleasis TaxID=2725268 RepID=A0A7L6N7B7_9MOLU|nr:HD domain-containing phosphohydrolase [Hujiaoplasma nucleasis]QLY40865.1 diguanylate cyclase [Hujiaoplasma nucleasis]
MKITKKIPRLPIMSLVLLFLVVMTVLFAFISDLISDKQIENLTLKRDVAVSKIQRELVETESLLISMALSIENGMAIGDLEEILNDIDEKNDNITQMFYGLEDDSYIITDDNYGEAVIVTQRPWYIDAKNQGGMVYTDAYLDEVTGGPVMTLAIPVYGDNQQLKGVLGADVSVVTVTDFIRDFIEIEKGYAFLLDSQGQVIGHPLIDHNSSTLMNYDDFDIPFSSLNKNQGITSYLKTGNQYGKISYMYFENSSFVFGIFMTRAELNQSLITFLIVSISILVLMVSVFTVIIIIYKSHVEKPMNRLIEDINRIDISKNSDFRLETSNKVGFTPARIALNNLIDMSVNYQDQLEESLEELSLENQKFESLLSSSSDIVFVIDTFKRYINVFGSVKDVLGISKEEIIGKTHEEAFGYKYAMERNDEYDRVLNGESVIYSWESHFMGKTYYFENILNPIFNQDKIVIGAVGVARDITEQENRYQELLYISTHDYLTDLYNRKVYYERLKELNDSEQFPFAVINLDFNGLKLINDAFGHEYGDLALKKTAEILKNLIGENDSVYRVSGDEFSVIMVNAYKQDVIQFRSHLFDELKKTKIKNLSLSVAMGYFIQKDRLTPLDEVRKNAENDMYRQKILDRKSVKNKAISAILKTLTDKYDYEKRHSERVMKISAKIGKALKLDDDSIKALSTAALFHDIGKISLPDNILNKADKLTPEEYEVIKTHTSNGYEILNTADEYSELAIHASSHHERYDGKGYPHGLKGEQIPYYSRIICIADAYEAMTSDRPYRRRLSKEKARQEIIDNAGSQFDPKIAKVFIDLLDKEEA